MHLVLKSRKPRDIALRPPLELSSVKSLMRKTLVVTCAYNEERALPSLLSVLKGYNVLVVDDGSTDGTARIIESCGVIALSHQHRIGKVGSLADAIDYARRADYETVVGIDADAIPEPGVVERLVDRVAPADVGATSARQIPVGTPGLPYYIDELIWATLVQGKRLQMRLAGTSHLGGVMIAFKIGHLDSLEGSVNDDEQIGVSIHMRGLRVLFADDVAVYFDASSSLGHIFERRKRMVLGHMMYGQSTAPSMQRSLVALAFVKALIERPRRLVWALPALTLEVLSHLVAWHDMKRPKILKRYKRWVTTFEKDSTLVARSGGLV